MDRPQMHALLHFALPDRINRIYAADDQSTPPALLATITVLQLLPEQEALSFVTSLVEGYRDILKLLPNYQYPTP